MISSSRGSSRSGVGNLIGSKSIVKFHAPLFGEGKFNSLAGRGTQTRNTFFSSDGGVFNRGNLDGSGFGQVFACNNWQWDGFVNTGLDRGGVGNGESGLNNGDNGDVVRGSLGNFLAVVVSIAVSVSVSSMSRLADSDHLDFVFLFEGDFDGFAGGLFFSLGVRVAADFLGDEVNALGTDGTDNIVGEVYFNNDLDGQFNGVTLSDNDWGAHFSGFNNIDDWAVVFGVFRDISVVGMVDSMVDGSMVNSMVGSMSVVDNRVVASMMDTMDKLSLFSVCGGECSDKG
jgi:hypothetical protein